MTIDQLDQAKTEAFAHYALDIGNHGMLALLISVGHQLGLWDTLAVLAPSSSAQIADAAGLDERYVREWLAGTVTGRLVDYDPASRTYHLPPEHAASLTRAAGGGNLAVLMPFIAQYGTIEQRLIECFRHGGGVPYDAAPQLQHLQAELSNPLYQGLLVDTMLPLVTGLTERLLSGAEVLDIGCGRGRALNLMAQAFPASRFTGYDFQPGGIGAARAEAQDLGLTNVEYAVRDAMTLDQHNDYDLITTFDVIHDLAQPVDVLRAIRRALKQEGVYFMIDIAASSELGDNLDHPLATALYTVSLFHCMTVSLAQGGAGLGTMWGEQRGAAAACRCRLRECRRRADSS